MKKIKVFITMALAIIFSLTLKGSVNAVPIYYVDGNSTLNSEYGYTMNLNNISGDRIEVSSNFRWSDYKYLTAGTQLYNVWTAEWPSKGDTWIRYKNVGAVNGRSIDLKVTLADYGSIQAIRNGSVQPQVVYYANSYNFYMIGMSDTILRYEFLASGTNDRVDFKGYLSLLDLDWAQYVEAVSGVDSMYILNGTRLYVDGNAIRSRVEDDNQNDDANPQFLAQVFINNGAEIKVSTTRWTADLAIYSLGMSSLAPFEQPQPTKNVDKAVTHVGETVTYTINQFIPMEDPSYLYDNFVISDNISSAFTIQSGNVKVLDQNNNDASYIFDISINGNNVSARMKWDYLRNQGYYSNTYKLVIPCTVNSNLIGFTNANGTYIDNNSSVTTTRGTKTTNTVTTEVKYQISTSIDHGSITDTIYDIKGGSSRTVYFTPQKGYYISKIVVDGVEQNINNFNMLGDSYTISNISSNHSVQVYTLPMRIRIKIDKQDKETGKTIQADAKFEGAEYSIYKDANCTNFVEKLTVDKNGYATSSDLLLVDYVNGSYNYTETYYVKETKAPTGYNIDTNVYTVYQNTASQNVKVAEQTVTSKEKVIKNSIEITKYIEETDSTLKQKLSGVVFKAVLNSDTSKVYYSTQTDNNGKCVISDLPYGTYTISEVKIPGIAFDGKFHIGSSNTRQIMFEQFIGEDKSKHSAYVYGDITNIAKKMQITVYKEDTETGTITQGDAHLENAEYTLYRDAACTDAVETLTIAKNTDGTYSATSGWYLVGTYYVKETKAPEGYLIDEKVYTVAQDPAAQTEEYTKHIVTSKDNVKRNNIDITKYLEKTDSTEKQNLAGAEFTAQLVSKNSPDSNKLYKAVTDANGNCTIKDLPYGTYRVWESKVPDTAYNGEFYINGAQTRSTSFEQFIELDKTEREAYRYADITDVAKKMQITVYKEDTETGTTTQGDAHLENAEYTLYRDAACTDAVETLTIAKNTDGTYSATSGWYLVGTYYVKETKAPEGYLIDEKVYTVAQDPAAQTEEYTKHIVTSKDNVKRNNIDITKYLEKTDSTEKQNLAGAEFTAQLVSKNSPDSNKLYKAVTDANGNCTIKDLPYGTYRVWESKVPDTAYNGEFYINGAQTRSTSFEQFIELDKTEREAYKYADITDVAKKMQITVFKEDNETGTATQGDAHLENAEYTLYRDAACTDAVETITIAKNEDGTYSATSGWYLVGTYYVKETKAPEGYLIDEKVYTVAQDPAAQKDEHTKHTILSKDKVMEGMVKGIKYNNNSIMSEKTPAVGAKLRLTLDSNPEVYYEGIVDENGYLEFVDTIDDTHYSSTETHCKETCYPYTIPYGVYTISEVQKSNSGENIFINKQKTEIRYEGQTQRYILDDEYVRMRLTITIKDSETQKLVPGGATYKIWDVNNQRWYEEMIYPSGEKVTEFTTDEKGQLTINRHLEAGSYVIYEVKAPEGYYLNDELREGSKGYEFTIGVVQNGDVKLYHDDSEVTLSYVEMPYDNVPTKIYSYTAETYNDPQKAEIDIEKLAKQFSKVQSQESEYGKVSSPVFEEKGLAKVSFKLIAAEDIVTPEGTVRYTKGQVVSNIKTDKEGKAKTEKVYLGKYILEEVETPNGYINVTEPKEITIEYTNQYEKVQYLGQNISNETQKVELEFEKVYKELEVSKFKFDEKEAIFGIYTKEPVKNYKGESVIGKDELVDVIKTDDENKLRNNVELPEGKYYVKELYVSSPYAKTNDTYEFSVEYKNNKDEKIELTVNNGKVQNEASTAELELIVYPDVVYDELEIAKEKDRDTLEKLAELYGIADKTYGVYLDEKCEKAVQTIDGEEARFKTNEDGIIDIPDMPTGTYYLKEIEAPYGYEKSEEVIKAEINEEGKLVLLTAKEPTKKAKILRKYDTFTKDVIEGVEFEITDKEGNVVYTGKTNKEGEIEVPIIYFENEEKYYYEEKTAPKMYKADEEKYEFTAKVDEEKCEWKAEKIEVGNDRKTIEEVVIRKTDSKTGEALEGCVFTIALLDDEGKEYVNSQGETIYLVKEGVTNEEGEYVIKNVPYGRYRFIEVKAPEGYEMDEDMTGLEFTVDENSPEKIIFEVTNTGDIAVVALVIVAVVCVAGIVFVVVKNKKKNSK